MKNCYILALTLLYSSAYAMDNSEKKEFTKEFTNVWVTVDRRGDIEIAETQPKADSNATHIIVGHIVTNDIYELKINDLNKLKDTFKKSKSLSHCHSYTNLTLGIILGISLPMAYQACQQLAADYL